MKNINKYFLLLGIIFFTSCGSGAEQEQQGADSSKKNPPSPDFNMENSDAKAIAIADQVMEAMGGRKSWDDTRYISWNFFDARELTWDKHTGNVRVESLNDDFKALVNINTLEGKVMKNGEILTQPDSVKKYLEEAKNMWINDAYWLVMPYKLKDSGVTLKHISESNTQTGEAADVLQLTFSGVGKTPENKYHVFVDKDSHLVTQWSYFKEAGQAEPDFTTPWQNYQKYGGILLSGDRGERKLTDISVKETMPEAVFTTF